MTGADYDSPHKEHPLVKQGAVFGVEQVPLRVVTVGHVLQGPA